MNWPIIILVCSQLLFSSTDLLARKYMHQYGFTPGAFFSWWFLFWFLFKTIAMVGYLYVLSNIELGKSMALFGSVSIILSATLGFFILQEVISIPTYIGITLAISAFIILAAAK